MPRADSDSDADRLAEVARLRYVHRMSRKEIAAHFSSRRSVGKSADLSETTINKWLDRARQLGVIAFDIDRSFASTGRLNSRLSEILAGKLQMEESLVYEIDPSASQDPRAADLHITLANQTGRRFCEILGNKTAVLVAGGRTVVQIAKMIARKQPKKFGIRVDPLSGRNWTGCWQVDGEDDLERPLDADDAAVILASAFPACGTRFTQIGFPLYAEKAQQAQAIIREHCAFLPDGQWNWELPQRSTKRTLCGVGALHPKSGHRIMRFLDAYLRQHGVEGLDEFVGMTESGTLAKIGIVGSPDKSAPYLSRVSVELLDAMAFAAQKNLGYLGDVANLLFPSLPLPG